MTDAITRAAITGMNTTSFGVSKPKQLGSLRETAGELARGTTRTSVDKSVNQGSHTQLTDATKTFTEVQAYMKNHISAKHTTDLQRASFEELNDAWVEFNNDIVPDVGKNPDPDSNQEARDKIANKFYCAIERVLNRQDQFGQYIWGGLDSATAPIQKGTLAESKTLTDGNPEDYTKVRPDNTNTQISHNETLAPGVIHAGRIELAQMLVAVKIYQDGGSQTSGLKEKLDGANKARDQLLSELATNKETLETAAKTNNAMEFQVRNTIAALDTIDLVPLSSRLSAEQRSIMLCMAIVLQMNGLMKAIQDTVRNA